MHKSQSATSAEPALAARRPPLAYAPVLLLALALAGLTLYAYRSLPGRPFAADDYQWLLNVQERDLGSVLRAAFDPAAQTHFYRPLVWMLFWGQVRLFGLEPQGFHWVSLGLHLFNAALLGALAYRLAQLSIEKVALRNPAMSGHVWNFSILNSQFSILMAAAVVALHPAPFEAVVWVSSQSELAAAALLLLMLHLWLFRAPTNDQRPLAKDEGRRTKDEELPLHRSTALPLHRSTALPLLATLALGLALLAKESAVIGLPLLALAELWMRSNRPGRGGQDSESSGRDGVSGAKSDASPHPLTPPPPHPSTPSPLHPLALLPPLLLTLAYLLLQVGIERRNYLLANGGYGLGPQLALNPLRSLGLLAAPLPGTEHADAAWLVPLGAVVALVLLGTVAWLVLRRRYGALLLGAALALTLLPTAPFVSPPDSRYLYLPVMAAALIVALALAPRAENKEQRTEDKEQGVLERSNTRTLERWLRPSSFVLRLVPVAALLLAWPAAGELAARENRFAGATGPGGSLWRLAAELCAAESPQRLLLVEPPIAPPHAEAIVRLACGPHVRPVVVGRAQIEEALEPNSVVVAFPGGSAAIEQRR